MAANVLFALTILTVQVNTVGLSEQSYQPGVKVSQLLATSAVGPACYCSPRHLTHEGSLTTQPPYAALVPHCNKC